MFRETMSDFGATAIDRWWAALTDAARDDVLELWRATGGPQSSIALVEARYVNNDEPDDDPELWHNDFYEYLVNHEAYFIEYTFHVCTRHPEARAAVSAGFIPKSFSGPFARENCPMREALQRSPGKSIRLRLASTPDSDATG